MFDFPQYIEEVCRGVVPDCFLFELGVNGVFLCRTDAEYFWLKNCWQTGNPDDGTERSSPR